MMIPTATVGADGVRLSGLGNCGDCLEFDDSGNCLTTDTSSCAPGVTQPINSDPNSVTLQFPYITGANPTTTNSGPSVTTYPGATPTSTVSTGMTAAQAALYGAIINQSGTLAKELALQPGVSVSPTGAVSQQSAGYPIGTSGLATSLTGNSSMMMIAVIGIAAFLFMQSRH